MVVRDHDIEEPVVERIVPHASVRVTGLRRVYGRVSDSNAAAVILRHQD